MANFKLKPVFACIIFGFAWIELTLCCDSSRYKGYYNRDSTSEPKTTASCTLEADEPIESQYVQYRETPLSSAIASFIFTDQANRINVGKQRGCSRRRSSPRKRSVSQFRVIPNRELALLQVDKPVYRKHEQVHLRVFMFYNWLRSPLIRNDSVFLKVKDAGGVVVHKATLKLRPNINMREHVFEIPTYVFTGMWTAEIYYGPKRNLTKSITFKVLSNSYDENEVSVNLIMESTIDPNQKSLSIRVDSMYYPLDERPIPIAGSVQLRFEITTLPDTDVVKFLEQTELIFTQNGTLHYTFALGPHREHLQPERANLGLQSKWLQVEAMFQDCATFDMVTYRRSVMIVEDKVLHSDRSMKVKPENSSSPNVLNFTIEPYSIPDSLYLFVIDNIGQVYLQEKLNGTNFQTELSENSPSHLKLLVVALEAVPGHRNEFITYANWSDIYNPIGMKRKSTKKWARGPSIFEMFDRAVWAVDWTCSLARHQHYYISDVFATESKSPQNQIEPLWYASKYRHCLGMFCHHFECAQSSKALADGVVRFEVHLPASLIQHKSAQVEVRIFNYNPVEVARVEVWMAKADRQGIHTESIKTIQLHPMSTAKVYLPLVPRGTGHFNVVINATETRSRYTKLVAKGIPILPLLNEGPSVAKSDASGSSSSTENGMKLEVFQRFCKMHWNDGLPDDYYDDDGDY